MLSSNILTRFAPSPTGGLHVGHAQAAAAVFDFAKTHGGTALLRIEDIDHTRCRVEFTDDIYEDLTWLGFNWPKPVRVQSDHYADYAAVVRTLIDRGLAYACALTRSEIKAGKTPSPTAGNPSRDVFGDIGTKPTLDANIRLNLSTALESLGEPSLAYPTLRPPHDLDNLKTLDAAPSLQDWARSDRPDPVIARRDIGCSYHIAVTHDDALQGVTHVIRGADFVDQTPLHVLIQNLMGWRTPIYYHHPLVTDETGRKLSKSARDLTIKSLRDAGQTPHHVLSNRYGAL